MLRVDDNVHICLDKIGDIGLSCAHLERGTLN